MFGNKKTEEVVETVIPVINKIEETEALKKDFVEAVAVKTYRVFDARMNTVAQTTDEEEARTLAGEYKGSYKVTE